MSKKPAERKVIYTLRVYADREMSRAIEAQKVRRALTLAAQNFGSHNGTRLSAELQDGYSLEEQAPIIIGDYVYSPNAPP